MGLSLDLYRSTYESKNNVLAGWQRVVVTNVEGPVEPSPNMPAVFLTTNAFGNPIIRPDMEFMHKMGSFVEDGIAVPVSGHMAHGGAYAATSDSRFSRALQDMGTHGYFAVPVHDYSFDLEVQA